MNASEVTRCYSLEKGLGSGRIRISLLFRPVEAKLPPNLLGFDTGTLEIRDISAHSTSVDLSKCEVRFKVTTAEAHDKVSRKAAARQDDGRPPHGESRAPGLATRLNALLDARGREDGSPAKAGFPVRMQRAAPAPSPGSCRCPTPPASTTV